MTTELRLPRITLTGGRGRLAKIVRNHFESLGYPLTSVSRSKNEMYQPWERLLGGDLWDETETLIHLAWSTLPFTSEQQIGSELKHDIPILTRLLNSIVSNGQTERVHFVFFSSGGTVYGSAKNNVPAREVDECHPIGRYGQGKLTAENIIREFGHRHGLTYTILRLSNPFGYMAPSHKPQGIIPFLLKNGIEGTPFVLWGDGTARKDFLHYTDFLKGIEEIIRHRVVGTFNLSMGESHTINEVISLVQQAIGRSIKTTQQPAHDWDVHDSLLNNEKLRAAVNWAPVVSLEDGIRRAAAESKLVS